MTNTDKKPVVQLNSAQELRDAVIEAMHDKKGEDVISLDMAAIDGAICRYFVICSAQSTTQVDAIADNIEEHVRKTLHEKPRRTDGYVNAQWIVLDYSDVVVHVFQTESRKFYNIEELWADAVRQAHTYQPAKAVAQPKPGK